MKITSVGDNCIDHYVLTNSKSAGGNSINVAVYLHRLGLDASYVSAVGNDENGKFILSELSKKGVDVSHVDIAEGSTAVTEVKLVDGERILGDYDEGVLETFKLSEKQKKFILQHDMICSALWGNIHNDLKFFKDNGMIVAFDGATRPFDVAGKIAMKSSDYFFFAVDEYKPSMKEEVRKTMKEIKEFVSKHVIATLGEHGSMVYDGKNFYDFGIIKCDVVDTMGAGDSYIAGYLKGISDGFSIEKCMEEGAKSATTTIGYFGAW